MRAPRPPRPPIEPPRRCRGSPSLTRGPAAGTRSTQRQPSAGAVYQAGAGRLNSTHRQHGPAGGLAPLPGRSPAPLHPQREERVSGQGRAHSRTGGLLPTAQPPARQPGATFSRYPLSDRGQPGGAGFLQGSPHVPSLLCRCPLATATTRFLSSHVQNGPIPELPSPFLCPLPAQQTLCQAGQQRGQEWGQSQGRVGARAGTSHSTSFPWVFLFFPEFLSLDLNYRLKSAAPVRAGNHVQIMGVWGRGINCEGHGASWRVKSRLGAWMGVNMDL